MRMKIVYSNETLSQAKEFANLVLRWFKLLNSLPEKEWGIEELKCLSEQLVEMCVSAGKLPAIHNCENEETQSSADNELQLTRKIRIEEAYRYYYALFWPYEGTGDGLNEPDNPVMGDLVDDIYDISNDLKTGYEFYDKGMMHQAVFVWRLLFISHWGEHAAQALYAIDHAIRDYMNDDDMGKHEKPEDIMYYPAVKYSDIDGFFIVHVSTEDSFLPYEIVINSLGLAEDDIPMIGVVVGEKVIFISVSEQPQNLSRMDFPDQDMVCRWIVRHLDTLIKHWNKEISDRELLEEVFEEDMDALPFD